MWMCIQHTYAYVLYAYVLYVCVYHTEYWVVTILDVGILSKSVKFLWILVLYLFRGLKHFNNSNKMKTKRHFCRHFTAG